MKNICTTCGKKKADEGEEICQDCMELSLDPENLEDEVEGDEVPEGIVDEE